MRYWRNCSGLTKIHVSILILAILITLSMGGIGSKVYGSDKGNTGKAVDSKQRRQLYEAISLKTGLEWSFIAAIDQYERTLSQAHPKTRPLRENALTGIYVTDTNWSGYLNPEKGDTNPTSIQFFHGIGKDGSGDGIADHRTDEDLLYSVAAQALKYGSAEDDFSIGLWEYYHNTRAVQRVLQFAKLYKHFDRLDLSEHAFPLPLKSIYSFRSTWGYSRGWGGKRVHEGTDIFANHGVPVRSTSYGVIEIKGWNAYGGWRIGIRDLNNLYHYYAHLSGFDKKLKAGDIVRPGQTIGWVGSSGYGRPGTQGKFPPHLHYGVYRDRGLVEWAFDPYPLLRRWEREERKTLRVSQ
ncbi:M23 family metallopeptidase [Cohnella sp. WQ 127256]|uniref:M23 family metallopeptidase n=1 Tax=Cohnella sp. WQ 127256 TaxID=2938790 RepID=UPI0021188D97|nr:M23 family metallopeptidase [Cohnella sp. WQ 127256]